jgi:hypothetical protein
MKGVTGYTVAGPSGSTAVVWTDLAESAQSLHPGAPGLVWKNEFGQPLSAGYVNLRRAPVVGYFQFVHWRMADIVALWERRPEHRKGGLNEPMNELEKWANFYLLMSAAAATLLGLMFVVITMAAERRPGDTAKIPIYLTSTIIYFCSVLYLAALLAFPNHTRLRASICTCLVGVAGLVYSGPFLLGGAIRRVTTNCMTGSFTRWFHLRHTGSMYSAESCSSTPPNADSPWWLPVCCRCLRLRSQLVGHRRRRRLYSSWAEKFKVAHYPRAGCR